MILGKDDPTRMKGTAAVVLYYLILILYFTILDCIKIIRDKEATEEARLNAFDELEMLVEGIDNASNMDKMSLWPVIFECLQPGESLEVIHFALWIIGTCAQNNPETQKCLQEKHGIFARLLQLWQREPAVQSKIMYCFSCLLSNNAAGLEEFVTLRGFGVIEKFEGEDVEKKLKFLLTILGNQIGPDAIRCLISECPSLLSIESEPLED